MEEVKVLR